MKLSENARATRSRSSTSTAVGLLLLALFFALTLASSAGAAATNVPLGTAGSFAVLAGTGITNTGPTTVNGDIGTSPTPAITGAASLTVSGTTHAADGVALQAQTDLITAYNDAAGQGPTSPIVADLGGQTLSPGVYNSGSTIGLTGALTLDAGGNANAVFVFQAGSGLTTASASQVNLTNGAQSCNVFWQIGSSAALGTGSSFRGTIIALTSITVATGATIDGRVLARNGTVTLDTNTITRSTCAPTSDRQLYCDPSGKAYDLVTGEDKLPPYNTLGLVPAYIDPVTGSASCSFPAAGTTPTPTTPTTTTPSPTTPTPTTPTPTTPTPKPHPDRRRVSRRPRPHRLPRHRVRPRLPSASPVERRLDVPPHARARRTHRDGRGVGGPRPCGRAADAGGRRFAPARTKRGRGPPSERCRSLWCRRRHRSPESAPRFPSSRVKRRWLEVRLPGRPNGHTGWIRRVGTRPFRHPLAHRRHPHAQAGDGLPRRSPHAGLRARSSASRPPRRRPAGSSWRRRSRCGPPTSARRSRWR